MAAPISLGIDIGGTFTDLVAIDHGNGRVTIWKESTTPDDPSRGALDGLAKLLAHGEIAAGDIGRVVHATTLFTNALIERKGAPTGLLTTAGFGDVLEIGRERKYELYDLAIEMPPPLVPRLWRREAAGRLAPDGSELVRLDVDAVLRETEALAAAGVRSLAIVFLHSYANPAHERQAAEAIERRFPDLSLSLSCDVAPEIREYPRASTTVANAYVRPIAEIYLDRLEAALARSGIPGRLFLMLSNGGLTDIAEARRAPVQLLESGPAAGALAGAWFGRKAGLDRVLAFDMGGTTAKLALVDDGEPLVAWGFEAARQKRFLRGSGLPIRIAAVELIEIGAGGGSIAQCSELDTLRVGPESAGAAPGPACYGRGGTAATVTDSDLALGYLDAGFFLGGAMRVDAAAADASLAALADSLNLTADRAAVGVHEVVNEAMAGAARVAIAERGGALENYTLLATGGAGPVHAWQVARKLGLRRLLCPPGAGAGSALGMLMAPARVDRVAAVSDVLERANFAALEATIARLRTQALDVIGRSGADLTAVVERRMADMRYVGQGFEITVALPDTPGLAALREAFEMRYRTLFTRTAPDAVIEIVALRLTLSAPMPGAQQAITLRRSAQPEGGALKGYRPVRFPELEEAVSTPVYDRYALQAETRLSGPAIVEENESTLVIGPGGAAEVLPDGSISVELPA